MKEATHARMAEKAANNSGGMFCTPLFTITGKMPSTIAAMRAHVTPIFSWLLLIMRMFVLVIF
jgi:hypothetical protein